MKQTDRLKRIEMSNENSANEYVNYENKLKPMLDFENEELKSLYFQHEPQLLAMAEKEAWNYLVRFRTLPIKDKTENNILLCSYPKFFPL